VVGKPATSILSFTATGYRTVERQSLLFRECFGFRHRVFFVTQADEDRGIVMLADPRKTAATVCAATSLRHDARRPTRRRSQSRVVPIGQISSAGAAVASPDAKREGKQGLFSPARRIPQLPGRRPARRRELPQSAADTDRLAMHEAEIGQYRARQREGRGLTKSRSITNTPMARARGR